MYSLHNLPHYLFYTRKSSDTVLTEKFTGKPNIEAFINDRSKRWEINDSVVRVQKKIAFGYLDRGHLGEGKTVQLCEVIKKLYQLKFNIISFIPYKRELIFREFENPFYLIKEYANTSFHSTSEDIFVIDHTNVDELLAINFGDLDKLNLVGLIGLKHSYIYDPQKRHEIPQILSEQKFIDMLEIKLFKGCITVELINLAMSSKCIKIIIHEADTQSDLDTLLLSLQKSKLLIKLSITGNHHQLTGLKFQVPPPRTLQYLSLSCLELTPLCIHASKVSIRLCSLNDLALVSMLDNNRDIKSLLLNSTYKNDELTINLPEVLEITGKHNITFIAPKQLVKINTYEQPVAPHRPDRYNNFQPENNHTDFKNISSRLDQGMLIDKYCQFLRLTFFEDEPLKQKIRKIHQGICEALSLYLKEKSHIDLSSFLALAKKWNGKQTELDDHLKEQFTELAYYVNKVYFSNDTLKKYYVGDKLATLLDAQTPLIISNPWHSIAVTKLEEKQWIFYDPNNSQGIQKVTTLDDLLAKIKTSLGDIIITDVEPNYDLHKINFPDDDVGSYIANGGFIAYQDLPVYLMQELKDYLNSSLAQTKLSNIKLGLRKNNTKGKNALILLPYDVKSILQDKFKDIYDSQVTLNNGNQDEHNGSAEPLPTNKKNKQTDFSQYNKLLSTWLKQSHINNIVQLCQETFKDAKTLLLIRDQQTLNQVRNYLQEHTNGKSVFYVDNYHQLEIIANRVVIDNVDGTVTITKGTLLNDFLKSDLANKVLLINYANFTHEEIISTNELLDKKQINGILVDTEFKVVGLHNIGKKAAYQGADFYSRFNKTIEVSPVISGLKDFTIFDIIEPNDGKPYEMYDDPNWIEHLFGKVIINGKDFSFKPGYLKLEELPTKLHLQNAPIHSTEFQEFWRNAKVTGKISVFGNTYTLPENFELYCTSHYDNDFSIEVDSSADPVYVLNDDNFSSFIGKYTIKNDSLVYQPGLISNDNTESKKTIIVSQTEELTYGQMKLLGDMCKEKNVELKKNPNKPEFKIIKVKNVESYVKSIALDSIVIDISELDGIDLFSYIETKPFAESLLRYTFTAKTSFLKDLLQENKVTLKGHFSNALMQSIATHLLLEPTLSANLTLVGDENSDFKNFSFLTSVTNETPAFLNFSNQPLTFKIDNSDINAEEFNNSRKQLITDALKNNQFVFVTGLSGCGKSTFIKKHFEPHVGLERLEDWIGDTSEYKYLFIDEANIGNNDWLLFADMQQTPPAIVYKGERIVLTPEYKIIFAGNPVYFGGERHEPKLFQLYPNTIIFDPIPLKVLKEEILMPLFPPNYKSEEKESVCTEVLKVYTQIIESSQEKLIISPRELQQMVMLAIANNKNIKYYAQLIAQQLDNSSAEEQLTNYNAEKSSDSSYYVTKSRYDVANYLRGILELRKYRLTNNTLTETQKNAGLGGIILEGEPGIGKTELIREILVQEFDFKKAGNKEHANIFYEIPPNIDVKSRKELLIKAFHDGAVVIIDEFNSGPTMEKLLNNLLMGVDEHGRPAEKPGFTILATQNPADMSGRRELSQAILNRMLPFKLTDYPRDEIIAIINEKGVIPEAAEILTDMYLEKKAFAQQNELKPPPCFRDLIKTAELFIKNAGSAEQYNLSDNQNQIASLQLLYNKTKKKFNDLDEEFLQNIAKLYVQYHFLPTPENLNNLKKTINDYIQTKKSALTAYQQICNIGILLLMILTCGLSYFLIKTYTTENQYTQEARELLNQISR